MFITLEGGEGVGKTTQQALLVERLRQEGYACLCTREPGGTALGKTLRELLLHGDPFSPLAELLLYAADRAEHVSKVIAPALAAGQVVVCDRFTDSTLAYQGYGRGLDLEKIRQLNHLATGGLQPHLTLWLDLPPEVGLARAKARDRLEQERLEFHRRVYQGFQALAAAEPQRIVRISAQGSPAEVAARLWSVVEPRLPLATAGREP
ncbi:thymidylate kinase [Synechococcus sp. JA-2-3B'a(2-13)]|uniref:Thymidylate kinase n=1 Tax=Synechococcus sp. (strain JA-2-3B'a(2-13)) TaxID=321332 RepID=KTHY_SYNJB|nr:dTMP kinase [Synechococcus sp. JA-2-3B'a(2-13)]Q2JN62.1 RecName: Full=Thymidylate kinase; AltName: Full=dTMP kinase [Synechococcus sp. JA-2-3B'a(2-13)]ABD01813.1 thymidylate kinase [Synechococcus sp. JA-2-3B'a(2-13)]